MKQLFKKLRKNILFQYYKKINSIDIIFNVKVKHFLGKRNILEISLLPECNYELFVDEFWKQFNDEENLKNRITEIYFMKENKSFINLLDKKKTFIQYDIIPMSTLFVFTKPIFNWNHLKSSKGFEFSNNNRIAELKGNNFGSNSYHMIMGNNELNKGLNYWEILLDNISILENVLIGVVNKDISLNQDPFQSKNFWGIQPFIGKQFINDGKMQELGFKFQKGQKIGFILEVNDHSGSLKIVQNNKIHNTIINNLQTPLYPFFCMLDSLGKISLMEIPSFNPEQNNQLIIFKQKNQFFNDQQNQIQNN